MCVKCQQPLSNGSDEYDDDEQYDEVMGRLGKIAKITNLGDKNSSKDPFLKINFSHGYGRRR